MQFFRNICGIQLTSTASGVYPNIKVKTTLSKSKQTDNDIWYFPFNISLDFRAVDYANSGEEIQKKIQKMSEVKNPDDVFNISQLALDLTNIMSDIENYSIDEFINSVNSQIGFVMPGNKTFTFIFDKPNGKVNAITSCGDLYMFGNYVQELE